METKTWNLDWPSNFFIIKMLVKIYIKINIINIFYTIYLAKNILCLFYFQIMYGLPFFLRSAADTITKLFL